MEIGEVIYARAIGYAGLTALVGTRIYPGVFPENSTYPAVAMQLVSSAPIHTMSEDSSICKKVYQFSTWGATPETVYPVVRQIKNAFAGYQGDNSNIKVNSILVVGEVETYDSQTKLYGVLIDFEIIFNE